MSSKIPQRSASFVCESLNTTLSDRDLRVELEKTETELAEKQAHVKRLTAGARPEEIVLARAELQTTTTALDRLRAQLESAEQIRAAMLAKAKNAVDKAATRVAYAGGDLERSRALARDGLISRQQFEQTQAEADVRTRELEEARADLSALQSDNLSELRTELAVAERKDAEARARFDLFRAGTRDEEIEIAEAAVAGLQVRRRHLEEQLRHTRIVSPISGIVTTPSLELKERVGQHVARGDLVAEVHDLKTIIAEIAVAEWEIADIKADQHVRVRARAYPGIEFGGQVRAIAATVAARDKTAEGSSWSRDRVMLVTTALDNSSLQLKPGMNGYAKISCGKRRIIDLLTRRLSGYIRTEFWSW